MNTITVLKTGFCVLILSFVLIGGCKSDKSTDPEENVCDLLSTSGQSNPSLSVYCGSVTSTVDNIEYDSCGRYASCDFKVVCENKSYSGKFYNIKYDGLGRIISYEATVNGKNCHFSKTWE
jgi:hypothetical protein